MDDCVWFFISWGPIPRCSKLIQRRALADFLRPSHGLTEMTFRKTAMWIFLFRALFIGLMLTASGGIVRATCINVNQTGTFTFEGTLTFHIFGGPPYNGGVRLGDTPEPTYILKLDDAICVTGDDSVDRNNPIDRIQVFPEFSATENRELSNDLRRLVGRRVRVEGRSPFGAHTGHHHAPLLLPIIQIEDASDPTAAYGTAMTTVQAFYLALAAGSGDEAASFVVPEKRVRGPLSANAITGFTEI